VSGPLFHGVQARNDARSSEGSGISGRKKLTRDLAFSDDLQDHSSSPTGIGLSDHALRHHAGLECIVETETTNMRVGADALNTSDVLRLWDARGSSLKH